MGLLQQAAVQWPDPNVPLGSESSSEIVAQRFPRPRALGGLARAHVGKLSFLLTPLTPTTCPLQPKEWKEPRGT